MRPIPLMALASTGAIGPGEVRTPAQLRPHLEVLLTVEFNQKEAKLLAQYISELKSTYADRFTEFAESIRTDRPLSVELKNYLRGEIFINSALEKDNDFVLSKLLLLSQKMAKKLEEPSSSRYRLTPKKPPADDTNKGHVLARVPLIKKDPSKP